MTKDRVIEELADCIRKNRLVLTIHKREDQLREFSLQNIQLSQSNEEDPASIVLTVFDEFDDVKIDNPVLWLHLIVDTCEGFEQAENYDDWRLNEGYKDSIFFQSLYSDYAKLIPEIRLIIGKEISALDSHHIEFNTTLAQELRAYKL